MRGLLVVAKLPLALRRAAGGGRRRGVPAACALLLAFALVGCDGKPRDFTPPVVTLAGAPLIVLSLHEAFSDPGAGAVDARDGILTVTVGGSVDSDAVGEYTLTYSATDAAGNTGRATRTVRVVDDIPPVVTLNGEAAMSTPYRGTFSDPGATATDDPDGTLTVTVGGSVDSDTVGEYTLTYSATDAAGNTAEATRTVRVVDGIPPVVTLNGGAVVTMSYRETFTDPGATAVDDPDGALPVTVTGAVESGRVGVYALTYSATDAAGNAAEATRVVRVVDDVPPTITLEGSAAVELERDEPFRDPGATAEDEIDGPVETTVEGEVGEAAGGYALVYRAVDAAGNAAEATRAVTRAPGDYKLDVSVFGEGEVTLAAGEATTPFRCGDGACFGRFQEGERVELEAAAGAGQRFDSWGVDVCDEVADGRCALTMDRDRVVLPAFVSEEPLTLRDDVVVLTPEQIEGLVFWAPHAGVAAFDEWTDLGELAPGSVMASYGVPDEDGFPTEPVFLARVLSVRETPDGSQLVATAPAGLDDLYASGTLVARGEFTRAALERARLAPGVKLMPAPEGAEGAPKLSVPDIGPLTDGVVTLSGKWVVYDKGDDFRAVLRVTATAAFTIVPTEKRYSASFPLTSVDLPVPAFPFIVMSVAPVVVPAVEFKGGVSKVTGEATLRVGGRLDRSTNRIWPVFVPDVKITKFVFDEAAGGAKPKLDLELGLLLRGEVSVFKVVGVRMNVKPYYGVEIEPGACELDIDPYWGVDASVTAFLKPLWSPDLEWTLYSDEYGPMDLSSFPPALACVDTTKPTPPGAFTATRAGRGVQLDWSASTDDRGVTAYRVYRGSGSGHLGTTGGTSYVDRNPGTGRHCYYAKAMDAAGNWSSKSGTACATVQPDPPPQSRPAKPAIEIVDKTSSSARVRWAQDANVRYSVLMRLDGLWKEHVAPASSPQLVMPRGAGLRSCYLVRAENSAGSSDSDSRCFTPQEGNSPPTAHAGDDFTVVAGKRGRLRGSGVDADGLVSGYAWTQTAAGPRVSLSDASSATTTFTAPATDAETTLTFRLTVTDDDRATGVDDVRATVLPAATTANRKPRARAGDNQDATTGETVTLSGEDSSDDHGIVAWRWEQWDRGGPDVSLSGANTENATFVAPQVSKERTKLRFDLTVTDGHGETDIDRVNVYVSPRNRPPAADAGPDQSVAAGAAVTLNGSGSDDPDGDALGYAWTQTSGLPTVSLSGVATATATFTAPVATTGTTLTFLLTVTDGDGATASDTVRVTVSPANRPPVANAGPDRSVASGAAVTLNGSGSDPDGSVAGYAWRQMSGLPRVSLSGASSATARFKAPAVTTRTTLTFRLTVTDDHGATGSDEATVTVSPPATNRPPVADAGPDRSVAAGAAVTLNGSGSDPDGSVAGYAWRQMSGLPRVSLSGATTATATFKAPAVTTRTTLTFRLTVTDDDSATGADYATVTVSPAVGDTPVNIPDAALRAKLLAALGRSAGDTITRSDMAGLTSLDAGSSRIADLTGLEFATSLTHLDLSVNSLSNISALSRLTALTYLNLRVNSLSNISALSRLTALEELDLEETSISDISALSGLTSLERLYLDDNSISDISALSGLTSLERLYLGDNSISDISALSELTSLTTLWLWRNSVSDISALSRLTSLTRLNLQHNSITNISALSGLTSLERLYITGNSISDISALSGLTSLTRLNLGKNSISDISALSGLTALEELDLYENNSLSDISALSALTALEKLDLSRNSISNISALSRLTSLTELHSSRNSISDISALSALTSLTELDFYINSISDISALSGLTSLTELDLRFNDVSDAGPLVTNTGLGTGDRIYINYNPLSAQSVNTHIPALRARGVTVHCSACPNPNLPPVADAGLDQSVAAGAAVTLNGSGSDPDGEVAGYAWTQTSGLPTVSLDGASSATATFTAPAVTTLTTLTFQLTVTDEDGATGSDEATVTVSPPATNRPPVANAGLDQSVAAGAAVTLSGSGSDPDGEVAGYAWTQIGGTTVSLSGASSATATFTAPAVTTRTTLTFLLTVTDDDGATGSDTVRVTVSPANRPPVANAGPPQSVAAGAAVTLSGSGSDPDGEVAGYAWTQTFGSTVTLSGASSATAAFTAPAVTARTTLTFRLTVTDNDGATGADETTVTVSPPATNLPPAANAGPDQSVAAGAAVTLSGSGSDPDGSVTGYAWTQTAGSTVTLSGASTATATFTAPAVTTRTTLTFRLTVTDDGGATGTDEATVTVAPAIDNTPVNVPDTALRTALLAALGKSAGDTITRSDIAGLTSFTVRNSGITDLTGLEFATSLTFLSLESNAISNISALSRLTSLTTLFLGANSISDISALSGLTSLRYLGLHYNNSISDISALSELTSLTTLVLTENSISDISALSGLTALTTLELGLNRISNISALSELTSLTNLGLSENSISDISALSGLTSLDILNLTGNSISDISALSGLTSLTRLQLGDNLISNISALSGLTSLTALELRDNSISNISALSGLTSLDSLGLIKTQISDISALSGLTSLTGLFLGGNSISDYSTLSRLTSLTFLHLEDNSMSDISALSGLTSLTNLWIARNSISDISVLSGLTSLRELNLNDNLIVDAKPLVDNTGLGSGDTVKLRRNPLSAQSVNTHIPAVRARGATVYCSLVDGTAC